MTRITYMFLCKYKILFLSVVASVLTSIQGHVLQFVIEPSDTVVEAGQSAVLDCVVKATAEYPASVLTLQWLDQDRQPLTFIGDTYRSQLINGSLYISSVVEEQGLTGNYQCKVSIPNVGAIVSRTAHIGLAHLSGFQQEPRDITVYPGQKAHFACRVQASPSPRIRWLKDERPLQLDELRMTVLPSGALEIDEVKDSDQGSYRCNASGLNSYRLSNKAALIINGDQEQAASISAPSFIALPHSQAAVEGQTITLDCAANGNPNPTIKWLKDGYNIDMADLDSRFNLIGVTTSLQIKDIQESDAGTYQCRAENREDSLDAPATIQVQVPPKILKKPEDKVDVINKDVEFQCSVYGKPEPLIQWMKNGEIVNPNEYYQLVNGHNLKILGLMTSDSGLFQCVASNPAGNVQAAASLKVVNPAQKPKNRNQQKQNRRKKVPVSAYARDEEAKPFDKMHSRTLFSNLKPDSTDKLGAVNFGHLAPAKQTSFNGESGARGGYDPHDIFTSLRSSESNNLGDILSAYTESSPHSIPFIAEDSESDTSKLEGLPGPPQELKASIVKARFITLSWQPPLMTNGNIIAYSIYYRQEGSERERVQNTTRSKLEDINIGNLLPAKTYTFRVVAYNSLGPGTPSKSLTVTTQAEEHVPSAPQNFHAYATGPRSIHAKWKIPEMSNGQILRYKVYYMEISSSVEHNLETTTLECDIPNLSIFTEYSIWIVAINVNGPGAATEEKLVRTLGDVPSEPPYNVTLEPSSSTSIIVRWEPPPLEGQNGVITSYKLRYRKQGSTGATISTPANLRIYPLNNLDRSSIYQVRLWAQNINGTGPPTEWSETGTFENDLDESTVPDQPSPLKVRPSSDRIVVTWNPPANQNIRIRNYIIGWGKNIPDIFTQELDEKQRKYVIERLESNSEYVISLRASNEMGSGPTVYANVRTTDEPPPEPSTPLLPPLGVKAQILSPSSAVLYWTDSSLSKSQYVRDNRFYTVKFTDTKNAKSKYINVTDLNVMIVDLKSNTLYEFTVKVVKGKRESPWSMVVQNTTSSMEPTLISTAPREVVVTPVDNNPQAVEVKWLAPKSTSSHITGYIILYTTNKSNKDREWSPQALKDNKQSDIIYNLSPSTVYYFKVQARNNRGVGPFSQIVQYRTGPDTGMPTSDTRATRDGHGAFSGAMLLYLIIGGCIVALTTIALVVAVLCCRRRDTTASPERLKKGYQHNQHIKPPDLWIHHDQMELKALEKSHSSNDGASSSGAMTLPRSVGANDYDGHDPHHCSSLDKRTYVPSYTAIPTAPPINTTSLSQTSSDSTPSSRPPYPRTQYSVPRAHVTVDPNSMTVSQSTDSPYISHNTHSGYETGSSSASYISHQPPPAAHIPPSSSYAPGMSVLAESQGGKRLQNQGHPLKSFSVPAPPPISAPASQPGVTIRPTSSPFKKAPIITSTSSSGTPPSRISASNPPPYTIDEVQPLQSSHSTEELNQEMANLAGLMLTLNAITANEFEC